MAKPQNCGAEVAKPRWECSVVVGQKEVLGDLCSECRRRWPWQEEFCVWPDKMSTGQAQALNLKALSGLISMLSLGEDRSANKRLGPG